MSESTSRVNLLKERLYREGELPLSIALEGFSVRNNHEIIAAWDKWALARKQFNQEYYSISAPLESCPAPPPDGAEYGPCREMWVHTLRKALEENKEHFHVDGIKQTVGKILASQACKTHPATCPCKVPNNPFSYWQVLEVLEPLGVKQPKPMVGGGGGIAGGIASGIATSAYKHNVDNCACGTCHKSRVDAGTDDAYYERCRQASRATENKVSSTHKPETCACGTCHNARVAAGTQEAYNEWNRKALEAALQKSTAKSNGYSATMRRVYCPSDPANASLLETTPTHHARRGLNPLK